VYLAPRPFSFGCSKPGLMLSFPGVVVDWDVSFVWTLWEVEPNIQVASQQLSLRRAAPASRKAGLRQKPRALRDS
jgi:hypothetical protein